MTWCNLADSGGAGVAYTEALSGLSTEVRTTRRRTVQHDITNHNVVLRLETVRQTLRRVHDQFSSTQALRQTDKQTRGTTIQTL